MSALIYGAIAAIVIALGVKECSGPSDKEVDATQNAQCIRWGAKPGSSDYIQCRATLAVNYQREQDQHDNSVATGLAIGMAAGQAGSRR
jgi:hypothetical protein